MEILIGLAGLALALYGAFSRTDDLLTEIRDVLIEVRDRLPPRSD